MKGYNRIMELFWLSMGILIVLVVTVMGFIEGFKHWYLNYIFSAFAFGTYLLRRFMRKRMEQHQAFLNGEDKSN